MKPIRVTILALFPMLTFLANLPDARGDEPPSLPGSAACLADWRWLARPPAGERRVVACLPGQPKLSACEGGFLLLEAQGPGVLDHVLVADSRTTLSLVVDGGKLWSGTMNEAIQAADQAKTAAQGTSTPLFPSPLVFGGGSLYHLIAPVGFERSLRVVADKATLSHFLSYRVFEHGTKIGLASPDPKGPYARELQAAARFLQAGVTFPASVFPNAQEWKQDFVLRAMSRETVLDLPGRGEMVHLEFHVSPALSGSLRDVVAELRYDGALEPAVRLPLPELVGVAHPWIIHRWHSYNGTLAAGLQYPWYVNTPRFYFPEDTFHFNLPVPFAKGLRVDLVNRSERMRFTGSVRALTTAVSEPEAQGCGRLSAARAVCPVAVGADPQPLLRLPGAGQLVGLGLFTTGGDAYPPAVHNCVLSLVRDGGPPVLGQGVVPLWFMGAYGGSIGNQPIWNHPLYDDKFGGVMRYFLTDPLPYVTEAVFGFTPGTDGRGAPTAATALAFWYQFGPTRYSAPPLPERAEPLPYSKFGTYAAQRDSRLFWEAEAEDLVPAARVQGGEVRAEEDADHNYHPSAGWYLHYVASQAGDYVDCTVPFPRTRYFAVGTGALWGPNRGTFEMDVLSPRQAPSLPEFQQGDAFYLGRVLGHVPMQAPVFVGQDLRSLRDTGTEYPPPFLNPAPDQEGVVRFICRAKPQESSAYLLELDQLRLDLPPPTAPGWREFEDLADVEVSADLTVARPKQGRFEWSGWGAMAVVSPPNGRAIFRALLPTGLAGGNAGLTGAASEVVLKGCLGSQQGGWQARILQPAGPVSPATPLVPGKDEREIVEWRVPLTGLRLPGVVLLEFTCTEAGREADSSHRTRQAELVLDAWSVR